MLYEWKISDPMAVSSGTGMSGVRVMVAKGLHEAGTWITMEAIGCDDTWTLGCGNVRTRFEIKDFSNLWDLMTLAL